jgi:hypothetical protein
MLCYVMFFVCWQVTYSKYQARYYSDTVGSDYDNHGLPGIREQRNLNVCHTM